MRPNPIRTWMLALLLAISGAVALGQSADDQLPSYKNYRDSQGPRSVHVVRIPRGRAPFALLSGHAGGRAVGLSPIPEQAASFDPSRPVIAALNGDFYRRDGPYAGDPRGLQIVDGELMSAPGGTASCWVDAAGEPHTGVTRSVFRVTWPDGTSAAFGLNGNRRPNSLELYTPAVGASTRTSGGRELILEAASNRPLLPLKPNQTYRARVRETREKGDTRLPPGCVVLSIGPGLARTVPALPAGTELSFATDIEPSLKGVTTALSGGPVLVQNGKRQRIRTSDEDDDSFRATSMLERHPRSAIGWNEEAFFLVAVDGRQRNSVGMTLNELAAFLVELGCREAMNLDGGGSSTLWFDGRIRNRPCDGHARPVANALVVVRADPRSPRKAAVEPARE